MNKRKEKKRKERDGYTKFYARVVVYSTIMSYGQKGMCRIIAHFLGH
jgi:hypothetical protein